MRTTKKTRLSLIAAGTGAAALAVAGFALPANADDHSASNEESTTTTTTDLTSSFDAFQTWVNDALTVSDNQTVTGVSPDTSVGDVTLVEGPLVSDSLNGDLLSGNQTPVASGNQAPIASGNDVAAPVLSGNDTNVEAPVDAPVGSGNDVSAPIDAPVGSGNETHNDTDTGVSVGDIGADVDDLVDSITSDLDLGDILG